MNNEIEKKDDYFCVDNIRSSAKFVNFLGLSENQIIEKYEKMLLEREKEVKEITYQMGILNEKYFNTIEKIQSLKKENEDLENQINKKKKLVSNEIKGKQIMNEKIVSLTKENEEIRKNMNDQNLSQNLAEDDNNKLASEKINYEPLFSK